MNKLSDFESMVLSPPVLEEIAFWRFIDSFTSPIPWRQEQHIAVSLSTDSSDFKWGATAYVDGKSFIYGDYWSNMCVEEIDICVKETMALFSTLQSLCDNLWNRRVDILVDNEGLVKAWNGLRASSIPLAAVLREIFLLTVEFNCVLNLQWVPSKRNPSDAPSRSIDYKDSTLSSQVRRRINECFGPFHLDLMALPSNVMVDVEGRPLPFFSRFPMPYSTGVNVFAQGKPEGLLYVFPPFGLIPSLLRLFLEWGDIHVVLVVPVLDLVPLWWNTLQMFAGHFLPLFSKGDVGSLIIPTRRGYAPSLIPSAFGLSAVKCFFPAKPRPTVEIPNVVPPLVVIVGDSIIKVLVPVKWPVSLRVHVKPRGGDC
jgi:hypothetical protein